MLSLKNLVKRWLVKSAWRKHFTICLLLGVLAVPVYFLDRAYFAPKGGNWITLDFRGLVFWTYITLLAIDVPLSSIAVLSFRRSGVFRIHAGAMMVSVILLFAGLAGYDKLIVQPSPTNTAPSWKVANV